MLDRLLLLGAELAELNELDGLGADAELVLESVELALLFELRLSELYELLGLPTLLELEDETPGVDELDDDTLRVDRLELDSEGRELEEAL